MPELHGDRSGPQRYALEDVGNFTRDTETTLVELRNPDPDGDGIAYNGKPVLSPEEAAQQLTRTGAQWPITGNGVITYTFAEKAPGGQYNSPKTGLGATVDGFAPFTEEQRETTRDVIGLWDDVLAIGFVEKNGKGADIVYLNTNTGPGQAGAYTPFYGGEKGRFAKIQGDTFINQDQPSNFDLGFEGYGYTTLVHETGHAIGLQHPSNYNAGNGGPISYGADAEYFQDSYQFSVMSYFHAGNTGARGFVNWARGGFFQTPQTPMVHDILAAQSLYGADTTTRTGDTTYGFNSTAGRAVFDFTVNENPFLTIWDAGGHDTLDLSGFYGNVTLDLREGEFSSGYAQPDYDTLNATLFQASNAFWDALYAGQLGSNPGFLSDNIAIAYGVVIEDGATGNGNDRLIGNDVANMLDGGAGSDTYTGGAGADTFVVAEAGWFEYITDFVSGEDTLDLSAFGVDESAVAIFGNQVFVDVNGDGGADLAVVLTDGASITLDDMVFG
ncbi:MAG: M10 family metallopeptidase [Alteraurantiacibacter sp.]